MRRLALLLMVVLAGLALAGCGGGKKSSTPAGSTAKGSTTESFTSAANCKEFAALADTYGKAFQDPNADLGTSKKLLEEFASRAPTEIRADFQTLADGFGKLADALKGVDLKKGTASPEVAAKLAKAMGSIDQAKLTKASTRIAAWTQKNCKTG